MTKKRCSLSSHSFVECVYLHEAYPQVRKWAADKKVLEMPVDSTFLLSFVLFLGYFTIRRAVLYSHIHLMSDKFVFMHMK